MNDSENKSSENGSNSSIGQDQGSIVELSISGINLRDMDIFTKSDPICVVYVKKVFGATNTWYEVMRTECIKNTLNPKFAQKVEVPFYFEEQQEIKFEFYHMKKRKISDNLKDQDFIGKADSTLGQIVTANNVNVDNTGFKMKLNNPKYYGPCGEVLIFSEELLDDRNDLELEFIGANLDKKDLLGSSDPFLQILRSNTYSKVFTLVYKTEYIRNNVNPHWKRFTVSKKSLCNGDLDRPLKIECFDYNKNGKHSIIGEFFTTTRHLLKGPGASNIHPCINIENKISNKANYQNSGHIHLTHSTILPSYSFLDYICGGTELNCSISIDFSGSGSITDHNDPQYLHHLNGNGTNQYEMAISSVGKILEDYSLKKLFQVYGFGASLPEGTVSHHFAINDHPLNAYCQEIGGVLAAYKSCLNKVKLHEDAKFSPSINHLVQEAKNYVDGNQYFILMIVSDGIIIDLEETKSAIVDASVLPISIIIVGVGDGDFTAMKELDGDVNIVTDEKGRVASRDIVQFVAIRDFSKCEDPYSLCSRVNLAKEVLDEIPEQLTGFMKSRKIVPDLAN